MKKDALFCDGSKWYVSPQEPGINEKVTIRFRTAKEDAVRVSLIPSIQTETAEGLIEWETSEEDYELKRVEEKGAFAFYAVTLQLGSETFRYSFEIRDGEEVCLYQLPGVVDGYDPLYDFEIVPGFSTPDWAKGAVMYQIYTDRFCNGDPTNDVCSQEYFYVGDYVQKVDDWYRTPDSMDVRNFYGGDLEGVRQKLDYLQDLGVEVLYFNPIFVSPSNHKYDIQDYDHIDPHFGKIVEDGGEVLQMGDLINAHASKYQTRVANLENLRASNEFFADFVKELHQRGMKIILDGVFNHCGSFNKWMDKECIYEHQPGFADGAYVSVDSPYHDFFHFQAQEDWHWPYNGDYEGWWGFETLPKLNYESSKELEEYVLRIGKKWVSEPYNCDGWRLDVAADLGKTPEYNHRFWKKFRKAVKEANPNALILAEHYGSPRPWLKGDEWDSVMNYDAFMEPITWFLTGMEKHSDEFRPEMIGNTDELLSNVKKFSALMMRGSQEVAMNELSNHDHSRFLTRTNRRVGRLEQLGAEAAAEGVDLAVMRMAVLMQMTWVGAPTVYYGDEAGLCGFTDPDDRRTYPWGRENQQLIDFHKKAIWLHREHEAFRTGSFKILYSNEGYLVFARFTDEEEFVIVVNRDEWENEVHVPVWPAGLPMEGSLSILLMTDENGYAEQAGDIPIQDGYIWITTQSKAVLILGQRKLKK